MTMKPCADCGELTDRARCPKHRTQARPPKDAHALGYDWTWRKLSRRARRMAPFCEDCGTTENLSADHSPEAWQAKAAGRAITLDMLAVVCLACNARRGAARGPRSRGEGVSKLGTPTHGKAEFQSEIDSQQGGDA